MNDICKKRNKLIITSLFILMMVFLYTFFSYINPITISDADDWLYACYYRNAIPIFGEWNPARVFFETVMPLVSKIGVYIIYPLTEKKDIFMSITSIYALCVSIAIMFLMISIYRLIKKYTKSTFISFIYVLFVLICHFWAMRSSIENNTFMFYAHDATVYFTYVIPNMINAAIVINCIRDDRFLDFFNGTIVKKSLLVVLIYLCIFSNIWSSIILAVYCGNKLLHNLIKTLKNKETIISLLQDNLNYGIVLLMWFVQQVFELSGARAANFKIETTYFESILISLNYLLTTLRSVNKYFILLGAIIIGLGTIILVRKKETRYNKYILFIFLNILINELYLILSCAKVNPSYISRSDVYYVIFFWYMVLLVLMLYVINSNIKNLQVLMCLIIIIAFFNIDSVGNTFKDVSHVTQSQAKNINIDLINQVQQADYKGSKIKLYVPYFNDGDNWPYALYIGDRVSNFAYKYKLTDNYVEVTEVIPTTDKNYLLD